MMKVPLALLLLMSAVAMSAAKKDKVLTSGQVAQLRRPEDVDEFHQKSADGNLAVAILTRSDDGFDAAVAMSAVADDKSGWLKTAGEGKVFYGQAAHTTQMVEELQCGSESLQWEDVCVVFYKGDSTGTHTHVTHIYDAGAYAHRVRCFPAPKIPADRSRATATNNTHADVPVDAAGWREVIQENFNVDVDDIRKEVDGDSHDLEEL